MGVILFEEDKYLKIPENKIGITFRNERKQKGWTLPEMAKRAGLHYNTIGLLERGQLEGSVRVYLSVAKALGYSGIMFEVKAEPKSENKSESENMLDRFKVVE